MKNIGLWCLLGLGMLSFWGVAQPSPARSDTKINAENPHADKAFEILMIGEENEKTALIGTVAAHPNDYIPPVLFALSQECFINGEKEKALFWFYLAQVRARYDVQLSIEKLRPTGKKIVGLYIWEFGRDISRYAFQHPKLLQKVMVVVYDFMRYNEANYCHTWLYLDGKKNYTSKALPISSKSF